MAVIEVVLAQELIGPAERALAITAVIAGAIALFLVATVLLQVRGVERDLETRLSAYTHSEQQTGLLARLQVLRRFVISAERYAARRGVLAQMQNVLEQANIQLRPGEAMAAVLVLAIFVGIAGLIFTGNPLVAVVLGGLAAALAGVAVALVAAQQRRRFENQLPDTLNLMATSLRAGYSMLQALEAVSSESPDPTAREFRRVLNEIRLGRSAVEALSDSATRMESVDFDWVVLAFTIQREVGGNLAEVLQTTAETMLQRTRLRREMHALTAEGRISSYVLGAMPFGLAAILFLSNRSYLQPMFESTLGTTALVASGVLLLVGLVWLNRIVKVEV